MAITPYWYGNGMLNVAKGNLDLRLSTADAYKICLHTTAPNQDTHAVYADVGGELSTANGYTSGGASLSSLALTYDATSNEVRFDCADPAWTFTGAVTWRYASIYRNATVDSLVKPLVAYLDWGASQTVSTGYTLQIAATGLLYITVS